jgi:primosomal protein N''
MNKDLLIALMQKDLSELNVMLEGIAEWKSVPSSINRLALSKAENIVASLQKLSEVKDEPKVEERQTEHIFDEAKKVLEPEIVETSICLEEDLERCVVVEEELIKEEADDNVQKSIVADIVDVQPSLNEVQQREMSVMDSVLDKNKVTDLIQSISLGDRFRFQRELFSNNGEEMMQAFHDLNAMNTIDEASAYLKKHFDWDMENESVKDFYAVLNRKF